MRGAQLLGVRVVEGGGIIPADAGSTCTWLDSNGEGQDHPRGCGEHIGVNPFKNVLMGSSPRMRGALQLIARGGYLARIIPADAGST